MGQEITTKDILRSKTTGLCRSDAVVTADDEVIPINYSKNDISWRLVHDGVKVLDFFESQGITGTRNTLFVGTEEECKAEIEKLGLKPLPEPEPTPEPTTEGIP